MLASSSSNDVLIEVRRLGNSLRVAAIDAATGIEVVVTGPASGGEAVIVPLAQRKLARALDRSRQS
jgi:Domain of unknown function (DUF6898)